MNDWRTYDGPPQVFRHVGRIAGSTNLVWRSPHDLSKGDRPWFSDRVEEGDEDLHVAYREKLQGFIYASGTTMKPIFTLAKRAQNKRVVYCEGEEERVLRAVQVVVDENLARPTLIGRPQVLAQRIEKFGLARPRQDKAASLAGHNVLVRVQTLDPIGDVFGLRPDIRSCMRALDKSGCGVLLYVYNKSRVSLTRAFERQVLGQESEGKADGGLSEVLRDFGRFGGLKHIRDNGRLFHGCFQQNDPRPASGNRLRRPAGAVRGPDRGDVELLIRRLRLLRRE